ncbi:hypothetical protein M0811_05461 [Anaeramoeba ignava]|uniref:Uncharacterized protein n=1 Tax=Anaeramoeba ignava TaxID=1746090 RepID=A0A9Q0REH8_ANAIG|nr:hypothetical protein M0811_05461 [Anaeramoeba ignava]
MNNFEKVKKNQENLILFFLITNLYRLNKLKLDGVLQHLMTIESAKECFEFEIPFLFDIRFDRFYTSQEEKQLFDNELEISYVLFSFPIFFSVKLK